MRQCLLFLVIFFSSLIWIEGYTASTDKLSATMTNGKIIYNRYCSGCHMENGEGTTLGAPALKKGLDSSSYITIDKPVSRNIDIILYGIDGTLMLPFKDFLSNAQLADVTTYIRNAWGNNTGDLVTPEEVQQRRDSVTTINSSEQYSLASFMHNGKIGYRAYCARCHQLDGHGQAPYGPKLRGSYLASSPELITYRIDLLIRGAAGTRMRGYAKQLSDLELAEILTYIANDLGNNGKQFILPSQIKVERDRLAKLVLEKEDLNIKYSKDELMTKGRLTYMAYCARCHLPNGLGGAQPGVRALSGSHLLTKGSVNDSIDVVLIGVPGSIMRTFANRMTNFEIAAIITYIRNAWGNQTGNVVQPIDVMERRQILQKKIDYQMKNQLIQQDETEQKKARKYGTKPYKQ